jgi:hypothetical protein
MCYSWLYYLAVETTCCHMLQLSASWCSKLLSGLLLRSGHMALKSHMGKWALCVFTFYLLLAFVSTLSKDVWNCNIALPASIRITLSFLIHGILAYRCCYLWYWLLNPCQGFIIIWLIFLCIMRNCMVCLTDSYVWQHATHWCCGSKLQTVAVVWNSYLNS